jgi:LAS superfamily LD-carboxypeptidase LdcB
MTPPDSFPILVKEDPTAKMVTAYRNGSAYLLDVFEVECGHFMDKRVVEQVRAAIQAGREDGIAISINSAFRTMERQTELYEGHQKDPAHFSPADRPGHSLHQQGLAIDLHFPNGSAERERFAALAVAHGMTRPHPKEPWHFLASPLKEGVS